MFKTTKAKTPQEYIAALPEPRRSDVRQIHQLIRRIAPGLKPHNMAGMIGYGTYHYKYASGREGDWAIVSLSQPEKLHFRLPRRGQRRHICGRAV